ncbi:hypothetical protein [Draconibacterium halophilum]|uniref:Outer membrane protein beta-barrel domain-containing protein n=1 Tax=Draconibacterium halophilum TaxID=2706887 RepID=A0A6C0RHZ8_9BACT|nr:hypothetical protein [Draconibacterium halophilum]QIA09462.1 hypothetical protein G0Q07_17900 [Draconibacterium halophilum]
MKTHLLFLILFFLISCIVSAQPQKGSIEFGGSGTYSKSYNNGEKRTSTFSVSAHSSYFVLPNLSVGAKVFYEKLKDSKVTYDPENSQFIVGPTIEAYLLNKEKFGVSIKSTANFALSSDYIFDDSKYTSFSVGPKGIWNISPNISTYLWFAYRDVKNRDDYTQNGSVFPSDNFDIRWGFSYYLHRKEKTE